MYDASQNQTVPPTTVAAADTLPDALRSLLWDCKFKDVYWTEHRDFVTGRILSARFDALRWLRRTAATLACEVGLNGATAAVWSENRFGFESLSWICRSRKSTAG
jgi:hypothetical protein